MEKDTIAIIVSVLGVNLGLFLYLSNKMDNLMNIVNAEMKDFHGRLCAIEEKNSRVFPKDL